MATRRPPVAAKGWPTAREEPLTLSLARSIGPSREPTSPFFLPFHALESALQREQTVVGVMSIPVVLNRRKGEGHATGPD